jgi:hypothetical protein
MKKKTVPSGLFTQAKGKVLPQRITNPDHLIEQFGGNSDEWEVRRVRPGKRTYVDLAGVTEELVSVKATFNHLDDGSDEKRLLQMFGNELEAIAPRGFRSTAGARSGRLAEISLPDYIGIAVLEGKNLERDIENGRAQYVKARTELISRLVGERIGRIVLPVSDEFCDLVLPKTQRSAWSRVFLAGAELLTETIELLAQIAPVDVWVVNDRSRNRAPSARGKIAQSKPYLGIYLAKWFARHKGVEVNHKIEDRKYYQYRKTLLCFVNDRSLKATQLASIVSTERPAAWGKAKHVEAHFGEVSTKEDCKEYNGVAVRKVDGLCPARLLVPHKSQVKVMVSPEAYLYDSDGYLETTYYGS